MVNMLFLAVLYIGTIDGDLLTGYGNNQYSVKTAYFWTYPKKTSVRNNLMTLEYMDKTCTATHVNLVARHGSRYPGEDDINMEDYTILWKKIIHHRNPSSSQFKFLNKWRNRYPKKKKARLTGLGRKEAIYLGSKFGKELYDLLKTNSSIIKLTVTKKGRTKTSAKEFYAGLTSSVLRQSMQNMSMDIRNDLLRPYDGCESYEKLVAKNEKFLHEVTKFREGQHYQSMISAVERRLGLNISLGIDDIRILYQLSGMEIGTFNSTDWSTILTDEDREVLEYGEDIQHYLTKMYGHELNAKVACSLVKNVMNGLNEAVEGKDSNVIYTVCDAKFSHLTTLGHFYTALGLFKDDKHLSADNFGSMGNRKFFSSRVLPMFTNAAFILYHCGGTGADNYVVKLYVNEIDTAIPGCKGNPCLLSTLNSYFEKYINSCNMDSICSIVGSKANLFCLSSTLTFLLFMLTYSTNLV